MQPSEKTDLLKKFCNILKGKIFRIEQSLKIFSIHSNQRERVFHVKEKYFCTDQNKKPEWLAMLFQKKNIFIFFFIVCDYEMSQKVC